MGGGEGVDRAFLLDLSKVLLLPMLCRNKTTLLNAFSQKQPFCFHNCFSFYFSFISIYIFLFLVRDLRFNNISVISNGDLAQLRYLTTLWVILSFSTLIILIWLVFVVVTFTVQFVTYLQRLFLTSDRFLSGNNIQIIEPEAFTELVSLKYL